MQESRKFNKWNIDRVICILERFNYFSINIWLRVHIDIW